MKKISLAISLFCLITAGVLFIGYSGNEKAIRDKKVNKLKALGFMEPYIAPYNEGNLAFEKGDYEEAAELYKAALKYNIPEQRECKIRINLALAMVTPIDEDYITKDNVEECIDILYDAIDVLTLKGCADNDEKKGHNAKATQLKNDIEDYIMAIQNSQGGGEPDPDAPDDPNQPNPDKPSEPVNPEKEQDIRDRLMNGIGERTNEIQYIKDLFNYDFNMGKRW